jgi:pimeloyl-ACP methyl ester carboxylesterase
MSKTRSTASPPGRKPKAAAAAAAVEVSHKAPSPFLLALEARAVFEWAAYVMAWPWMRFAPKGDGHPVLVLPGLIAGDTSTWPLRHFLGQLGYAAYPWDLGANFGPRGDTVAKLIARITEIQRHHNQKISLIGWSLGGAMARALAGHLPGQVRNVITLGSPLGGHPRANHAWRLFEAVSGWRVDDPELEQLTGQPLVMPSTSIFSKADGIVNWRVSVAPKHESSENIEIAASHLGLGVNPLALFAIADRLSQAEGQWRPFDREGRVRSLLFRQPHQFRFADLL